MASSGQVQAFSDRYNQYIKSDKTEFLREDLGQSSLKDPFDKVNSKIVEMVSLFIPDIDNISDHQLFKMTSALGEILNIINRVKNYNTGQYVNNLSAERTAIKRQFEEFLDGFSGAVALISLKKGLLNEQSEEKLAQFEIKLEQKLKFASEQVDAMISEKYEKLRESAAKISVESAQSVFGEAVIQSNKRIKLWSSLTAIGAIVFIIVLIFLKSGAEYIPEHIDYWKWQVVSFITLKITILSAIAAITSFFAKMLRSALHLREHNQHRHRLTMALGALVTAASPDQRDMILSHIIDAIVNFGHSGLLKDEDSIQAPKTIIETLSRNIGSAIK